MLLLPERAGRPLRGEHSHYDDRASPCPPQPESQGSGMRTPAQCAAEVAHVVGQPVDQHGERHGDTGEDVHHREEPQHSLLHGLGLLVHRSSCHVALHAEVLHKPQAETHQEHEDTDDRLATSGSTGEVIGHADNAEHIGLGELLGGCYVERAQRIAFTVGNVWNGRQRIEHGHEHRALNEHRQAGASRIDVIVLIQFHGFTAHGSLEA